MSNLSDVSAPVGCGACALGPICLPHVSVPGEVAPVECHRRLARGETLYHDGSARASVYAVRSGSFRVMVADGCGGQHIARFLLPGDAAGLDALGSGVHRSEASSLEESEVCEVPADRIEMLADVSPRIGAYLRRQLAREVIESHAHGAALARLTAAQRVARFLLELSRRWAERGFDAASFAVPMSRREIGEHLGLTMETVSRMLSDFQARGCIRLPHHRIEILKPEALAAHA